MISVIIPCYNMELYVERCYNSLKNQRNAENVEFIFINDGSKDDTLRILDEITAGDSRSKIISQDNSGVSSARNRGLEAATGEYVFLVDGDDYLPEDTIDTLIKVIENHHPDLIMPAFFKSYESGDSYFSLPVSDGLYSKEDFFRKVKSFPTIPQNLYKTQIIKQFGVKFNTNIKCGEVYSFTVDFLSHAKKIYALNTPCYNYFQRADSATHKPNYKNDLSAITAVEEIYANSGKLKHFSSFDITAFKIALSFTYNKYIKFEHDEAALEVIDKLLSNQCVKTCISKVLLKPHFCIKEKFLALYISIMPKLWGFKILNKLYYIYINR